MIAATGVCFVLLLLAGCGPTGALFDVGEGLGRVQIQLRIDARDLEELATLEVEVESVGVHRAGQPIEAGWVTWPPARRRIDLLALSKRPAIALGASEVPAGRYDRAWVVVEAGRAEAFSGGTVPMALWVEPIAVPFELRNGEEVVITVELIALIQPNGSYKLFTKSADIGARHPRGY